MIRFAGTVTFKDGTTERYEAGTKALVAWEAYARRNGIDYDPSKGVGRDLWTMQYVLAHYALTGNAEGFAAWYDRVADLEPDEASDAAVVPPTLQEARAG